jgi:hypothetical protein
MSEYMDCHEYDALLARDLEGELSPEERSSADAHLTTCDRCAALRNELVEIAAAARALPVMSPSRDLWDGIAARIDAPVIPLAAPTPRSSSRRQTFRMAAAAAALVAATAGVTYVITTSTYDPGGVQTAANTTPLGPPSSVLPPNPLDAQVVSERATSAMAFEQQVVQLRGLLDQRRDDLDSATVALLEQNLRIIDRAIAESRAALEKNPGSALLNRQLNKALGQKVQVLRTAALLPAETQ